MKKSKLAEIIKDAVLQGTNAANEQWRFCVMSQQQTIQKQAEQNLLAMQEQTKQSKIMGEREYVQIQFQEKQMDSK